MRIGRACHILNDEEHGMIRRYAKANTSFGRMLVESPPQRAFTVTALP